MKSPIHLKEKQYIMRLAVIAIAALSPFVLMLTHGVEKSLSRYWTTDMQPLFIFTNIMTAHYLLTLKDWQGSAVLLLALTGFSVELYGSLHDTLAIMFFLMNLYPLYKTNHYRWVILIYLLSLPTLLIFGMLWAEIVAIDALCIYQFLMLNKVYKLDRI